MIKAILGTILLATAATAEEPPIWDIFLKRCVAAIEATGAADTSGLEPTEAVIHTVMLGESRSFTSEGYALAPDAELAVTRDGDRPPHGCSVAHAGTREADDFMAQSEAWLQDEVDAGRWRESEAPYLGRVFIREWDGPFRLRITRLASEDGRLLFGADIQ